MVKVLKRKRFGTFCMLRDNSKDKIFVVECCKMLYNGCKTIMQHLESFLC